MAMLSIGDGGGRSYRPFWELPGSGAGDDGMMFGSGTSDATSSGRPARPSTLAPFFSNTGVPWRPSDSQVGRLAFGQDRAWTQRAGLQSFLYPMLEEMARSEGYSAEEKNAILQEALGGVSGTYNSLRDRLSNRLARTRNAAGYGATMSELGRAEAREKSAAGRQAQISFADEKFRRQLAGAQGLSQLYGVDTSFLNSLLAQSTGLQAGREGRKTGLLDWLNFGVKAAESISKMF